VDRAALGEMAALDKGIAAGSSRRPNFVSAIAGKPNSEWPIWVNIYLAKRSPCGTMSTA
jgi:hypothetical protein